ncbi:hypothetical protein GPECTOR_39g416 [Gonium pectorale]|uniref:Small ribosomal subunit protein uS3 C-terminal domain-containing protein n=1 Tax=Gonium pectorale TaxID=33097 RepID=A0A150GAQ0_GONPE|nr:hypothetical protein GPECTOR_39g416 [Gonium pectorale]|eukprot:KXZ46922.1 hypothetical protein GPECTOR_39g416 [Gonium pectorale]
MPLGHRGLSGKAKGGGKGGAAAAKAAPPAPPPPPSAPANEHLLSAGARLQRRRPERPDPLTLLTPQQRALAEALAAPPPPSATDDASGAAAAVEPAAAAAADGGGGDGGGLVGLGQLGLPLGPADVASLLQQSLGGAVGQGVAFRPFVFDNLFQSAPAAASYVAAALESGTGWARVERFFLAAVEAAGSGALRGVRIQAKGRLSLKNDMAQTKAWQWGELKLQNPTSRLDYGAATALTRLGAVGVKVWISHGDSAIRDVFFPRTGGSHYKAAVPSGALPALRLDELYTAAVQRTARLALPYGRFRTVAWWERPATAQPPTSGLLPASGGPTGLFLPDYDPRAGARLDSYLRRRREARRTFRSAGERRRYMETLGRFLAKQQRLSAAASTEAAAVAAGVDGSGLTGRPAGGRRPGGRRGSLRCDAARWAYVQRRLRRAAQYASGSDSYSDSY